MRSLIQVGFGILIALTSTLSALGRIDVDAYLRVENITPGNEKYYIEVVVDQPLRAGAVPEVALYDANGHPVSFNLTTIAADRKRFRLDLQPGADPATNYSLLLEHTQ